MAVRKAGDKTVAAAFVNSLKIVDKNGVAHEVPRDAICVAVRDEKLAELLNGREVTLVGVAAIPVEKAAPDYSSIAL